MHPITCFLDLELRRSANAAWNKAYDTRSRLTSKIQKYKYFVGRDSSVGIATRYGLDGPGIESRFRWRFSAPVQTDPGVHPASYTMGTGSFLGVKRPGRDVDHPPHLAPRLKKE